jgi:hypothetical protein
VMPLTTGSERVTENMLLARFRRYAAGAAEPETGSENFCGADALSGFAYRARPPTVNPLDGSETFS